MRVRPPGIAWVYGFAFLGLAFIVVSLLGNVVGSFSIEGDIGTFTLGNYADVAADTELGPVLLRTLVLGIASIVFMMAFAFPFAGSSRGPIFPGRARCSRC